MRCAMEESEAGRARRALAITCRPCRARKIKCDSRKPFCNNCVKNPAACLYVEKGKPGVPPKKAPGDVLRRLDALESLSRDQAAQLAAHEAQLSHVTAHWNLPSVPLTGPSRPCLPGPMLSGDVELISPMPDYSAFNGISQLPAASLSLNAAAAAADSGFSPMSQPDPDLLPPPDLVRDLIQLFYQNIHPWVPIFSPTHLQFEQPWSIVVYAIVVVSLRLSTDPRLEGRRERYKRLAKRHVLSHAIESTHLSSVQALVLLSIDLIGSDQQPSSWGILGLLTRSATHLGLTAENAKLCSNLSPTSILKAPTSWAEEESRRRLFWVIFILDRYSCAATGWNYALPDYDIKRRLPCSDGLWAGQEWFTAPFFQPIPHILIPNEPTLLSPLAFLVEAVDLLGRTYSLYAQAIDPDDSRAVERQRDASVILSSAAKRWFRDISPSIEAVTGMCLSIKAIHHATLLKLNAYYAFPSSSTSQIIEPFATTCLASAHTLARLSLTALEAGLDATSTPFLIWATWVGARVLFVHALHSEATALDPNFGVIVEALRQQGVSWPLANQFVELLDQGKREFLDPTASRIAITILLDLRRVAYSAIEDSRKVVDEPVSPFQAPRDLENVGFPSWDMTTLANDMHGWLDLHPGVLSIGQI